jgi:hypothetical protein
MGDEPGQDPSQSAEVTGNSDQDLREAVEATYSADLFRVAGDKSDVDAVWGGYIDEDLRAFVERYGRKWSCGRPRLRRRRE